MVFSREAGPLKIATFNINNINKRLHNLTAWLARAQPDVVCLQELKAEPRAFPASALRALGYRGVWLGQRSWNGVAILARDCDPVLTRSSLPGNPQDGQARYIEAAVNRILIASINLPNGSPQPWSEVQLQTGMVRAFNRARQRPHDGRCARRIGRRLQRCTNGARHLSNAIFRQQRIWPTSEPAGVRATVVSRLDGCSPEAAPRRTALDVLGLRARPVDCKQGHAARSLPAFADNVRPTRGWRCRPRGAWRGERQRPCASVDRAGSLKLSSRPMHSECSFAAETLVRLIARTKASVNSRREAAKYTCAKF